MFAFYCEVGYLTNVRRQDKKMHKKNNNTNQKIPHMVTLKEAAELTGLSYDYLRKGCIRSEIVHIRTGAKFLINLDKLIEKLNGGANWNN